MSVGEMFLFRSSTFGRTPYASVLLLMLLCVVISEFELVKSDHTSLCVNLPSIRYKRKLKSMGMEKFPQTKDLWGFYQEPIIAGAVQNADFQRRWMTIHKPNIKLNIYQIKIRRKNNLQYLNGWFRVEVNKILPTFDMQMAIKAFVLYVTDDYNRRQNIGEFSLHFPGGKGQCPPNDANKYMVISCGGASRSEPLVSNMIVFARRNVERDGNIFPKGSENVMPDLTGKHQLNFYIRIPIQDCNQKRYLNFRARFIFDKEALDGGTYEQRIAGTYFRLKENVLTNTVNKRVAWISGGSDAIPSPFNAKYLDCTEQINLLNLPWYAWQKSDDSSYVHPFSNEMIVFGNDLEDYRHIYACEGFYFKGRCSDNFFSQYNRLAYSGNDPSEKVPRQLVNQNEAHENVIPVCEHRPAEIKGSGNKFKAGTVDRPEFVYYPPARFNNIEMKFPKTHDYIKQHSYECKEAYNEDKTCVITTVKNYPTRRKQVIPFQRWGKSRPRADDVATDAAADKDANSSLTEAYTGNGGNERENMYKGIRLNDAGFPKLIWGLRKGHASLMALVMFFVLPVSLFVTRYYKESFMDKRILFSRVWYQVHIQGTMMLAALLFSSLLIAIISRNYLGVSLTIEAKAHRIIGYFTIILFIMLAVFGGLRGYEDPLRKSTICAHWFMGLLFYIFMVIEMTTAVFIPASSVTGKNDRSLNFPDENDDNAILIDGAFIHVIVWIVIEMIMHALMTFNLFSFDNVMGVDEKRLYFPVPIPVIREHSRTNASGHGVRVVTLWVYILMAVCSTAVYFIINIVSKKANMVDYGLGPMSCTHDASTKKMLEEFSPACSS